jgi:hypothetical protein
MQTPEESQYCYNGDQEVPQDHITCENVGMRWHQGDVVSVKRRRTDVASSGTVDDMDYSAGTISYQTNSRATGDMNAWRYVDISQLGWFPQECIGDARINTKPPRPYDHSAYSSEHQHLYLGHSQTVAFSQQRQWPQDLTDLCELKYCLSSSLSDIT